MFSRRWLSSGKDSLGSATTCTVDKAPTTTHVIVNDAVCHSPREANTDLLDFLNQSDIQKRRRNIDIPFFTAGSYLAVTRADPHSPTGTSKFVGICIARRNKGLGSTFILRNVIGGVGVEIMYELYSPAIREIEILKLRPLLQEEGLHCPFLEVEMPSLVVLAKAELNGIRFSREECEALKQILQLRLTQIEAEAYTLAGRSFSLTSPEDVSRVLFLELQLPPPSDLKQQKTLGPNRQKTCLKS